VNALDKVVVGLLGFGNVGTGFAAILEENRVQIEDTLGCSISIKKILVREPGKYKDTMMPEELFTSNARRDTGRPGNSNCNRADWGSAAGI
jgi:homoserine dehydrogenase